MPSSCCAPNCKSNYGGKRERRESVRVYRFPSDPKQRAAWTRAVARENFAPTKYTVLCEKHFLPGDFRRMTTYTDPRTGKVIEVPLERLRLKHSAVPSVFAANCPNLPITSARDAPQDKMNHTEEQRNKVIREHPIHECRGATPPGSLTKMVQTDVTPLLDAGVSSSGVGRFSLSTQTPSLAVDRGTQACPSDLHDPPYFFTKFYSRSLGYSCERCKKVFYTQDILDRHWQNEHVMSRRTVHTCAYCPYSNVDKARIVKHERTHTGEKPFRCEYCQKSFAARGNLVKHYQVHTGEKKHVCSHCGKAFAWKRNLKLHLLSHTGGRRYSCRQCGKKFCDSTHLRTHERLVHLRLYMLYCPHCCKGARTAGQLRAHIRKEHDPVGEGDPQKDSEGCFLHVKSVPMEERTAPEEVVQGPGVTHIDVTVVAERHVLLH